MVTKQIYDVTPYEMNGQDGSEMNGSTAIQIDNPSYVHDEPVNGSTQAHQPPAQIPLGLNGDKAKGARPEMKPRRYSRGVRGSVLTCHDLYYTVQVPAPGGGCCAKVPKEIIRGVNGIFKQGMNAIMGPTGGGKTTMLDTLAGRKNKHCISGTLLMDGKKYPENFKLLSGYVVQDDVVMGTLTVRENIMFSANLRLVSSISMEEKQQRVEETLRELGLIKCADSRVGNEFIRGVSGGERKRTNIGMELIIEPNVLFLDEPTTGLDASTSNAVMMLLQRLSRRGRTIVFSIHQPRYSIFKLFDRLTLMAAGRTAYHGPAQEALTYFNHLGYECEEHNNPPDFFLDVINGDSTAVQSNKVKDPEEYDEEEDEDHSNGVNTVAPGTEPGKSVSETLGEKFRSSTWHKSITDELDPIYENYETSKKNQEKDKNCVEYNTSFFTQLKYIAKRNILNIIRNPQTSILQIFVTTLFAVVAGLIFLRIGDKYESGIQNRIGILFFVTMNMMFSNLSSVELFIKERTIFLHETSSGFYRVSSYFISKIFCDVVPMRVFPLIFFTIITYFMVGLQENAGKFFLYFFTLFLTTMVASSIGFAVSARVRVFAIANLLTTICYVLMMIFAGLLVNIDQMGDWLSWLQYLSLARYALNALSINELNDLVLNSYNHDGSINMTYPHEGYEYLTKQGIKHYGDWDLWQNHMALILLWIGIMSLAYFQLRRLKENK